MVKLRLPLMVSDQGEGVLIFPASDFAKKLAEFKRSNPDVVVTAIGTIPYYSKGEGTETYCNIVVNCEAKWRYSLPA